MVNSTTIQRVFYVTDLISGCMVSEMFLPSSAIPVLDQSSHQPKEPAAGCISQLPQQCSHSQLASHQ